MLIGECVGNLELGYEVAFENRYVFREISKGTIFNSVELIRLNLYFMCTYKISEFKVFLLSEKCLIAMKSILH